MLPELGGNKLAPFMPEILRAFKTVMEEIAQLQPEAILICSPHYVAPTSFEIGLSETYEGDLSNFHRSDVREKRRGNLALSEFIQERGEEIGFLAPSKPQKVSGIDYGTIVPLRFVEPSGNIPIIPVSISMGSKHEHFLWGQRLAEIVQSYGGNIVFIASTELTQDFNEDPRAYPDNRDLDIEYLKLLIENDEEGIDKFPEHYFSKVENDLLPTVILSGFGSSMDGEIILYSSLVGCGTGFLKFS